MGVAVTFKSMIFLPDADAPVEVSGDDGSTQHPMKVLLGSSQTNPLTDVNGLATLVPSTGGFSRPLEIEIVASAGAATPLEYELPMLAAPTPSPGASTGAARTPGMVRRKILQPRPTRKLLVATDANRAQAAQPNTVLYSLPALIELEGGDASLGVESGRETSQHTEAAREIDETAATSEAPPLPDTKKTKYPCEQDQFGTELRCDRKSSGDAAQE
jgi:hypothetical protein